MYLKISQKKAVTAEYWPVEGTVSITTIQDGSFETSDVIAEVRMNNGKIFINKSQNAWLVNEEGKILEVINRDYMWS
jgi:hypothetical protein